MMILFSATRLGMFWMLSGFYYLLIEESEWEKSLFIGLAVLVFTLSHLRMMSTTDKRIKLLCWVTDFLLSAAFGVMFADENRMYLILFGVIAVTVYFATGNKKVLYGFSFAFFLTWGAIMLLNYLQTGEWFLVFNIVNFSFVVHGAIVGSLLRMLLAAKETISNQYEQLTDSHSQLVSAHKQLESYSRQVEELATIRERNRIARDIHDTIGHHMTALVVQLRLAQEVMPKLAKQSREILETCERIATNSLADIRLSVHTLHEEERHLTLIQRLRSILQEFSQTAGMKTTLQLKGDPTALSASWQPTIEKLVQEALTNAARHGFATECEVRLNCMEEAAKLVITDNGCGASAITPGFGLFNMRERVEQHGGTIQYTSEEGKGFTVIAQFPLKTIQWIMGGDENDSYHCSG